MHSALTRAARDVQKRTVASSRHNTAAGYNALANKAGSLLYSTDADAAAGPVTLEIAEGGVAVVRLDIQGATMNTLTEPLMRGLQDAVERIDRDDAIKAAVVISGKDNGFVAGADINMLSACKTEADVKQISTAGQEFFTRISNSKTPFVAAIHGACLGGGLELASACHYRIATNHKKTTLAVPEVMLGLLPGATGTQRLPKLVGIQAALDMMLTGKSIRPSAALRMGLVDRLCDPLGDGKAPAARNTLNYLETIAIGAAKDLASGTLKTPQRPKQKKSKVAGLIDFALEKNPVGRGMLFKKAREMVNKKTLGNYPAPPMILDCVEKGASSGQKAGYELEADNFAKLAMTPEAKALMGLWHGQQACKKNSFGKPDREPKNLAVLGAGLMGAGIVQVSLDKGYNVTLKDVTSAGLGRGEQQIYKGYDQKVKRKRMTAFERNQLMSGLHGTIQHDGFKNCDMVIEAVFEEMSIKHRVIKEVEQHIPDHCIFASNTSSLPITEIAEASSRPENFLGMHYFSPVDKMPLLEIITTDKTSKQAAAAAVHVGLKQGKTVIVVKDGPGFYTTRILAPFVVEAMGILQDGVGFHELDNVMKKFGFPVGPVTLTDEVGIDVGAHVSEDLYKAFGERMGGADLSTFPILLEKGILGRKSGKGFYLYDNKAAKGKRQVNPEVEAMIKKTRSSFEGKLTPFDIQHRMATRMANEAVLCLQDGILKDPLDGDIGAVFGLGFPPFLGGPFRWVDQVGAREFADIMLRLRDTYGPRFEPAQLILDHAKSGKPFHSS